MLIIAFRQIKILIMRSTITLLKFTTIFCLFFLNANAQSPPILWQRVANGSLLDMPKAVTQTLDGGFISAGQSNSANDDFTGNHGGMDGSFLKYDSDGNLIWHYMYGGSGSDIIYSMKATSDGGCIAVGSTG